MMAFKYDEADLALIETTHSYATVLELIEEIRRYRDALEAKSAECEEYRSECIHLEEELNRDCII